MSYAELNALPEAILAQTQDGWSELVKVDSEQWSFKDIELWISELRGSLEIDLSARTTPVKRIIVRWHHTAGEGARILGDHWERAYGDLEWRGIVPERVMPWYFLVHDKELTHGYGVKTQPNALCFWKVSQNCISLCLDVRNGGMGVILSGQRLKLCEVVQRKGSGNEPPFAAASAFCKLMCSNPLVPDYPVYGGNNWYYAYGKSSHQEILDDAKRVSGWASSSSNRPFMVIDDGWQEKYCYDGDFNGGPWRSGNSLFPDMEGLALQIKSEGARPGIWYRPLYTCEALHEELLLPSNPVNSPARNRFLDPSQPDALAIIAADAKRLSSWGYELIKYDFATFDIFGRWGFEMNWEITGETWAFKDRSKTSAQIIKKLYETIHKATGNALLIGCNTIGHLGAGFFHIQRTGDDTSGREWERTRKMGINTLAFRAPQHGAFFACDADCVGLTSKVPWMLNKQWMSLLSRSGTPLFISAAPDAIGKEQEMAIRQAFDDASRPLPIGEPLDWMDTTCPTKWLLNGEQVEFSWEDMEGTPV